MTRREPDLTANRQTIADLRAAAAIARQINNGVFAALLGAAAAAAEDTPVAARFGIPQQVLNRDVEEELRWAPVLACLHALAKALLSTGADERVDLDRIVSEGAR